MQSVMPSVKFAKLDNLNLAFREWGSGEPLLMVHGLGTNSALWINQFEPLGRRYRLLAVDLRGFGHSDKPSGVGSYAIERFAEDLVAFAQKSGISKLHYLSTSMGGFIGQTLALHAPTLVRTLILAHTAPFMNMPQDVLDERLAALSRMSMTEYAKIVAAQALASGRNSRLFDWLCGLVAGNVRIPYAQVLAEGLHNFDLRARVSEIKIPVLVIVGGRDRVIPPQGGHMLAASIAGAQTMTLPRSGHIGYAEEPELFNEAVLSFLGGANRH